MIEQTIKLIKEYTSREEKYSIKSERLWFTTHYSVFYEDKNLLETTNEFDALRIADLLNSAAKASFIEGIVKADLDFKYNSMNFMLWTLSEKCEYRTNDSISWFNINDFNNVINVEKLYEKWLNSKN